ncbi:MAG: hypothetical protein U0X40_10835 [Ferruginibacter sp.]
MKKLSRLFKILFLTASFLRGYVFAQDDSLRIIKTRYAFEESKTISKTFALQPADRVELSNRYGKIEIHPWNRPEIKADIKLVATAKTAEWAKSVLNDMDIETAQTNGHIIINSLFVSDLDKKEGNKPGSQRMDKYRGKNSSQTLEVIYDVYMPVTHTLKIKNMLGAIVLPDYKGGLEIENEHGILVAGKLDNLRSLKTNSGKVQINEINNCTLLMDNTTATFKKLSGTIRLTLNYCKGMQLNLDNSLKKLDIKASYSVVALKPAAGFSGSFRVKTNFGNFSSRGDLDVSASGDDDTRIFKAKAGTGARPVNVDASFGRIIIGDLQPDDMNEVFKN